MASKVSAQRRHLLDKGVNLLVPVVDIKHARHEDEGQALGWIVGKDAVVRAISPDALFQAEAAFAGLMDDAAAFNLRPQ